MSQFILRDQKVWFQGYDLTGSMNALALEYGADAVDNTAFGNVSRSRLGGLKTIRVAHNGFWDFAAQGSVFEDNLGVAGALMSFAAADATEGSRAYTAQINLAEFRPDLRIGDAAAFSVAGEGVGTPLVQATLMHDAARVASANGTGRELGAVAAGQSLYALLHVVAASAADTLDVVVQSDTDNAWASPTARATFAQAAALTSERIVLAGPVTDTWWRVTWTIAGVDPSFTFAVVLGIQ